MAAFLPRVVSALHGVRLVAAAAAYAAVGTREMSQNITGVSEAVEKAGKNSGQLKHAAESLAQQVAPLRQEVDRFLATLRAA